MGKIAQLVMGPAGSGKSTYCHAMAEHCAATKRSVHVVNLDPAAERFLYRPSIDIRDLISLADVTEELKLGPNGGLVFCMEYLVDNVSWLQDQVADFDNDYLIIDCPGQIELFSHLSVMHSIVLYLQQWNYHVCGIYLLDSLFLSDAAKFVTGSLTALSAMVRLEIPHLNVISKCDLVTDPKQLKRFRNPDVAVSDLNKETSSHFHALNEAVGKLIEEYSLVSFLTLNLKEQSSIEVLLAHIDHATQFGEDEEPREPEDGNEEEEKE